jgi:hypothetical protein
MAFHDQIRIFAADHQGNDSATEGMKKWKHGGADKLRTHDPTKPFRCMTFERLGGSRAAADQRSCHEERHQLHCDILSNEDAALFNERVTKETLFPFCGALQASRKDDRPCRAAILCEPGITETGLEDATDQVAPWGTKQQKAESASADVA